MSTIATQRGVDVDEATREPPRWLLIALGAAYLVALSVLIFAPGGTIIERLRALDAGICAQLPTHSFYPGGQRLPLCARNTGIYLGFMLCMVTQFVRGRGRAVGLPRGWVAVVLLAGVALMGLDGFNSLFLDLHLPHLYQPNNFLRLATGLLTGTAMASFLLPVANGVLWRAGDERTLYPSLRKLVWLLPVLLLGFLAVASTAAWLLYPIALITTAGVVLALSLINLTFVLAITGKVERFQRTMQAAPIFTVAVTLAVGELIGLFFLNHALLQVIGA